MNTTELEKKVRSAYNNAAPSAIDSIISDIEKRKGNVIIMETSNKKKSLAVKLIAIAAVVALLLTGALIIRNATIQKSVDITVMLDVNPSIEIRVNSNEKVLKVIPRNADAELIVGAMDFSGNTLEVTVNALIGSMVRHGYITEVNNSILISVESSNFAKSAQLQKRIASEVESLLKRSTFNGAVLSQSVDPDASLRTLADQYGITVGKAQLINAIIALKPGYTFESLVSLSINELNIIAGATTELPSITSTGTASEGSYIGTDAAVEIALNHAGLVIADIWGLETEMDYEHGVMVYEIEFKHDGYEYEYHINAVSGEIVKHDIDIDDDTPPVNPTQPPVNPSQPPVSPSQPPVNPSQPPVSPSQPPVNPSQPPVSPTQPPVSPSQPPVSPTQPPVSPTQPPYISMEQAKAIAFNHASVSESAVYDLEIDFDVEDGVPMYELEFKSEGYEYEYDINAITGSILKHYRELLDDNDDDDDDDDIPAPPIDELIDRDQALVIALTHAELDNAQISELDIELDNDDGIAVYEIEFKCGGYEYSYSINAATGSIIDYDRELDD